MTNKTTVTMTLKPETKSKFEELCDKYHYNKSSVVGALIEQWISEKKKQGQV